MNNQDQQLVDPLVDDEQSVVVGFEEQPAPQQPVKTDEAWYKRAWQWYVSHKKYSIPLTALVFLLILGGVPWSRYQIAGLVLKNNVDLKVVDSKVGSPVSGAQVTIGSVKAETGGDGVAHLHKVTVGQRVALVNKKYYADGRQSQLVPILKSKSTKVIHLVATGRQVKISVNNKINRQVLADVNIKVLDIEAKTDSKGNATVVLPAGSSSQSATLSREGYLDSKVTILVSDQAVKTNVFGIVPSGKVYFLSSRTGKISVMKSNLDGSNPVVVLDGTGSEDKSGTSLMVSPDQKYVALVSQRDNSANPKLYIISTTSDQLSTADQGSASFTMHGWIGNNLIYSITRNDLQPFQTGKNKLKSYNAATGAITSLDQSTAIGTASSSAQEYYTAVIIADGTITYAKAWDGDFDLTNTKQSTLQNISPDGKNHKNVAQYDSTASYISYVQHSPVAIYIQVNYSSTSTPAAYYDYRVGGSATKSVSLSLSQLSGAQQYLFSPSGKQTLWSEARDGRTAVLVADGQGEGATAVANLDNHFGVYDWYSDQYALLTKNDSELYIMGVRGGTPLKITDYQPSTNIYLGL